MKDLRRQIPLTSFLNGVIIPKADALKEVRSVCGAVMLQVGKPSFEYSLMNAAHIAGMLYCLLVVPRELFDLPQDDALFQAIRAEKLSRRFEIIKCDDQFRSDPEGQLLRRLRNAVSHGNFAIWDDHLFDFWDKLPNAHDHNWEARITRENLLFVLSSLGQHFGRADF